ncbi:UNVERIFIED_ORG: hypothetical protein J2W19_003845 [Shinella zoogloeoides]|nr:hypothetical protein [Shinella zoogloeoides]
MEPDSLESLKANIRKIGAKYRDRLDRSRRIYIEDRAKSLSADRDIEYSVKKDISEYFQIGYSDIYFCGSAQLGFSIHKDKVFGKQESDLDVACINTDFFQKAWTDIVDSTRAFSDLTKFSGYSEDEVFLFKEQILRRGMIRISVMPSSNKSILWRSFEDKMTRKYREIFKSVSIAIYMNEYAFCWKQDSALTQLIQD